MSIRTARVAEEIQKVLGERLIRGLRDPLPGFVTIRGVEVTSDFTHAKVFVSVFGSDAQKQGAIAGLNHQRGALRHEVGQKIRLRNTPNLQFILDESSERAARVHALLDEVKQHDALIAKQQAEQPAPAPVAEAPKPAPKPAAVVVEAPKPAPKPAAVVVDAPIAQASKPVVATPNVVTTTATLSTKLERGASGSEGVRLHAEPAATPTSTKKAGKQAPTKKAPAKKAPKKAPAKKAAKKAPAKKAPAKKAPPKKAAKKAPAKAVKKAPAKKAAKKAPAKKAATTTKKKKKG